MDLFPAAALRLTLSTVIALALLAAPAAAATSTWTAAGATSNWSDAGNWDAPPTPNCIMVFPAGSAFASKGAPVNDLIGQTIDQLNISETYLISGNAISCKNINDNSAGIVNVNLPISTAGSAVLTVTVTINGATLNLAGRLSGAGPVTYSGLGIKRLNGSVNNVLSGLSIVAQGYLDLDSTAAESIAGPLQINSGATARLLSAPEIKDSVRVTVNGTFDLSAATGNDGTDTELIGGLDGTDTSAYVSLGAKTLGCAAQTAPTNYLGGFQGTGAFRQSSSGVEVLSGTSFPYTGTTRVAGGAVHIWGQLIGSPVTVTAGTLVLANDSSVGNVTLSTTASVLSCDETSSAMAMHGTTPTLAIGSGCTYQVVAKSPTNYSKVSATVGVTLTGATLTVDTSSYSPAPTSVMTIIDNVGSSPVTGTFAGLAQGATVTSATNSGTTFTISYTGGTGNDVTLTGVAVASDTTAPVISSVTTSALTGTSATVTWTTGEAATSRVEYGATTSYGSLTTLDSTLVTSHSVGLSGLAGATLYHYRVHSRDAAGNLAMSADATFTTTADTVSPVVSAQTPGGATPTTVTVTWTTNEPGDSQIAYGATSAYGSLTTLDGSLVTSHSVTVTGLTASTTYHYQVLSRDAAGNLTSTADSTLTTSNSSGVGGSGGSTGTLATSRSNNGCGAGSALGLLGMVGLLLFCQLQTSRSGKRRA